MVITPSVDVIWVSALRTFLERGVRSLALVLDGPSFGLVASTEGILEGIGYRGSA